MTELDRINDTALTAWDTPPPARLPIDLKRWAEEFRDVYRVSEALAQTPFVPREMMGKTADVAAAVMKGRELGLNPFDALGSIYIVHGRVGYYADFMRRRIIEAGHKFRIVESSDTRCIVEGNRREGGEPQRATFSADQARKAGIDLGKYPADKLVARATSRLCKQVFPDVLSGTLIAEDLMDGVIPAEAAPAEEGAARPTLQRTRKPRQPKAAATQPPPQPQPDDEDIDELLGDEPKADTKNTPKREPESESDDPQVGDRLLIFGDDDDMHDVEIIAEEPELITGPQLKKLSILLKEAGFEDRESRHAFVAAAINRDITTAKELTKDEASHVIDTLENAADQ